MSTPKLLPALALALASLAPPVALADYWNGNGTCQYGWRYGGGDPWLGRQGCSNDWMCRDGNAYTWDRCVSGDGYDNDAYGRCKHGWRRGSGWWWSHEGCRRHAECRDGNHRTWALCDIVR